MMLWTTVAIDDDKLKILLQNPTNGSGVTPVSETVAIPHFGLLFDSILLSCRINHSW